MVGSALLRKLKAKGYSNLITRTHTELDLTRQSSVETFFQTERPEYVFLAAAKVGGILANNTYPAQFIYGNLTIQTNIIHAAWKTEVKRLLFLGSSCIYPRECPQPMKEEYLLTGPLEPTNEPYAVAKIAGIKMCQSYNRQYGTGFLAVMPTNLYGPNDNYDLETSHVLPALIRKFHLAGLAAQGDWEGIEKDESEFGPIPSDLKKSFGISKGQRSVASRPQSVTIWGTGSPRREFLHVDDLAGACVFIMNIEKKVYNSLLTDYGAPLINIGFGKDISIEELALMIMSIVGFEGKIIFDDTKPDGTLKKLLDTSRLMSLNWMPGISLKDGIIATYSELRKNENRI